MMSLKLDGPATGPHMPRTLARLACLNMWSVLVAGTICLLVVVALDDAARYSGIRLVPLYVPILCIVCWVLRRWAAVLFAVMTAAVAILPDVLAAPEPVGMATAASAAIRVISYIFLALIIAGYRRTYDEADMRAMHDGLTGVLNKVPFHAAAKRNLLMGQRARQTLLAVYVDLDDFKSINTHYGHAAGDAALRSFSREAMNAIRGSDLVGRLGGDEFGFLLSAPSEHNAEGLARLLHQRLTSALAKTGLPVTCSMGGMIVPSRSTVPEVDLFQAADLLLRKAKTSGKSMVVTELVPVPISTA